MRSSRWMATSLVVLAALTMACSGAEVKGSRATIGEGADAITVLHLYGTPYEMGYAHGKLATKEVQAFYNTAGKMMQAGVGMTTEKLDEIWKQMEPFIADRHKEEMRGLAEGSGLELKQVQHMHVIPDISEFHCTFFAAWGKATADQHLHQIRALDYATEAHIQDHPALLVYHPDDGIPFVNVGWCGFIGLVTGINAQKIAVSEIGESFGDDHETLAAEPMIFTMRRVCEEARTLEEAVNVFANAKRSTSFLYCVGDGKINQARALVTARDFCYWFDPGSLPSPRLDDVVYFSMGTDSSDWNQKVYEALKAKHGQINEQVGMEDIMKGLGTGDLHSVHFDVTDLELWVANAEGDEDGFARPFVHFDCAAAFKQKL